MQKNTIKTTKGISKCLLILAATATCAYAQQTPEAELPPVTVSAHDSLAVPYDQTGVSVSVLDPDRLKKEGVSTLPEALTTQPGVYALPGGGDYQRGNVSSIAIRGLSKSTYTLPMVDGMRISASGNGNIGSNLLARTNLLDLGTVEVLRGAQGATYGTGCMAAVIYMETPKGQGMPSVGTFQEGGSHDSYTGNLTAQGGLDKLSYFLSSTYDRTNNDLRFGNGTKPTQKHAGLYRNWSNALRVDGKLNDKNTLTLTYRREDSDYTDASDPTAPTTRYEFRTNLVTAAWTARFSDKWTSKLMAGYYGYDAAFGPGTTADVRNVQVEWRNAYQWTAGSATTFGLCWVRSDYNCHYSGQDSSLDTTTSAFAEHTFKPTKNWEMSLAARLDSGRFEDEQATFRAAGSYRFQETGTRVFASVGNGYNTPSQFQRSKAVYHSPWGGDWTGNPGLHCETSVSVDLGVEQRIRGNHFASATLFWTRTQDAIVADYGVYPNSYRNENGHQTSQGIELALHGSFPGCPGTGYRLGFTYTQPLADKEQIAATARQTWYADIHTSPTEKLETGLGFTAACRRTGNNAALLDNYYTLRWYARYEVNEHFALHLRVENLTNQKFVTQPGYCYPEYGIDVPDMLGAGLGVYAGCSLKF